jgi:5-deoxy-D-glucuronate isomerase
MILIKPDKNRRIEIPGVPAPVERPVDIDQALTGFTSLRTLRIYRFEAASVVEGHAEEDEVFIVLLSGSAELTMSDELASGSASPDPSYPVTLSAPGIASGVACAAYLPPGGAYKLVAITNAEVFLIGQTHQPGRHPNAGRSDLCRMSAPSTAANQHPAKRCRVCARE